MSPHRKSIDSAPRGRPTKRVERKRSESETTARMAPVAGPSAAAPAILSYGYPQAQQQQLPSRDGRLPSPPSAMQQQQPLPPAPKLGSSPPLPKSQAQKLPSQQTQHRQAPPSAAQPSRFTQQPPSMPYPYPPPFTDPRFQGFPPAPVPFAQPASQFPQPFHFIPYPAQPYGAAPPLTNSGPAPVPTPHHQLQSPYSAVPGPMYRPPSHTHTGSQNATPQNRPPTAPENKKPRRPRSRNSNSSGSSTSSSLLNVSRLTPPKGEASEKGFFKRFFTAGSSQKKARRRRRSQRRRGVAGMPNSSSSSLNSDLAYGHGYVDRSSESSGSESDTTRQTQQTQYMYPQVPYVQSPYGPQMYYPGPYAPYPAQAPLPGQLHYSHSRQPSSSTNHTHAGASVAAGVAAGVIGASIVNQMTSNSATVVNQQRSGGSTPTARKSRDRKGKEKARPVSRGDRKALGSPSQIDGELISLQKQLGHLLTATQEYDSATSQKRKLLRGEKSTAKNSAHLTRAYENSDSEWEDADDDSDSESSASSSSDGLAYGNVVPVAVKNSTQVYNTRGSELPYYSHSKNPSNQATYKRTLASGSRSQTSMSSNANVPLQQPMPKHPLGSNIFDIRSPTENKPLRTGTIAKIAPIAALAGAAGAAIAAKTISDSQKSKRTAEDASYHAANTQTSYSLYDRHGEERKGRPRPTSSGKGKDVESRYILEKSQSQLLTSQGQVATSSKVTAQTGLSSDPQMNPFQYQVPYDAFKTPHASPSLNSKAQFQENKRTSKSTLTAAAIGVGAAALIGTKILSSDKSDSKSQKVTKETSTTVDEVREAKRVDLPPVLPPRDGFTSSIVADKSFDPPRFPTLKSAMKGGTTTVTGITTSRSSTSSPRAVSIVSPPSSHQNKKITEVSGRIVHQETMSRNARTHAVSTSSSTAISGHERQKAEYAAREIQEREARLAQEEVRKAHAAREAERAAQEARNLEARIAREEAERVEAARRAERAAQEALAAERVAKEVRDRDFRIAQQEAERIQAARVAERKAQDAAAKKLAQEARDREARIALEEAQKAERLRSRLEAERIAIEAERATQRAREVERAAAQKAAQEAIEAERAAEEARRARAREAEIATLKAAEEARILREAEAQAAREALVRQRAFEAEKAAEEARLNQEREAKNAEEALAAQQAIEARNAQKAAEEARELERIAELRRTEEAQARRAAEELERVRETERAAAEQAALASIETVQKVEETPLSSDFSNESEPFDPLPHGPREYPSHHIIPVLSHDSDDGIKTNVQATILDQLVEEESRGRSVETRHAIESATNGARSRSSSSSSDDASHSTTPAIREPVEEPTDSGRLSRYESPNADVKIDNIIPHPKDMSLIASFGPSLPAVDQSSRPLLNIIRPTPEASPCRSSYIAQSDLEAIDEKAEQTRSTEESVGANREPEFSSRPTSSSSKRNSWSFAGALVGGTAGLTSRKKKSNGKEEAEIKPDHVKSVSDCAEQEASHTLELVPPAGDEDVVSDIDESHESVPAYEPSSPISVHAVPATLGNASIDVQLQGSDATDANNVSRIPGGFDDIEFSATLAAGLKMSGMDDALATHESMHKRTTPPGHDPQLEPWRVSHQEVASSTADASVEILAEKTAGQESSDQASHSEHAECQNIASVTSTPVSTGSDPSKWGNSWHSEDPKRLSRTQLRAKRRKQRSMNAHSEGGGLDAEGPSDVDSAVNSPSMSTDHFQDAVSAVSADVVSQDHHIAISSSRDITSEAHSDARQDPASPDRISYCPSLPQDSLESGQSHPQETFLDKADTLGEGVGRGGVTESVEATVEEQIEDVSQATFHQNVDETQTHLTLEIPNDGLVQAKFEDKPSPPASPAFDPEVVPRRRVKPAIDPIYGDLLMLPPSDPNSPDISPVNEDLPPLPDSRPDTPPDERIAYSHSAHHRRKSSAFDTPTRSPSTTAFPIVSFRPPRSTPQSPAPSFSTPSTSPTVTRRSRHSSVDRTIRGSGTLIPLFLPPLTRHEQQVISSSSEGSASSDMSPSVKRSRPRSRSRSRSASDFQKTASHFDPSVNPFLASQPSAIGEEHGALPHTARVNLNTLEEEQGFDPATGFRPLLLAPSPDIVSAATITENIPSAPAEPAPTSSRPGSRRMSGPLAFGLGIEHSGFVPYSVEVDTNVDDEKPCETQNVDQVTERLGAQDIEVETHEALDDVVVAACDLATEPTSTEENVFIQDENHEIEQTPVQQEVPRHHEISDVTQKIDIAVEIPPLSDSACQVPLPDGPDDDICNPAPVDLEVAPCETEDDFQEAASDVIATDASSRSSTPKALPIPADQSLTLADTPILDVSASASPALTESSSPEFSNEPQFEHSHGSSSKLSKKEKRRRKRAKKAAAAAAAAAAATTLTLADEPVAVEKEAQVEVSQASVGEMDVPPAKVDPITSDPKVTVQPITPSFAATPDDLPDSLARENADAEVPLVSDPEATPGRDDFNDQDGEQQIEPGSVPDSLESSVSHAVETQLDTQPSEHTSAIDDVVPAQGDIAMVLEDEQPVDIMVPDGESMSLGNENAEGARVLEVSTPVEEIPTVVEDISVSVEESSRHQNQNETQQHLEISYDSISKQAGEHGLSPVIEETEEDSESVIHEPLDSAVADSVSFVDAESIVPETVTQSGRVAEETLGVHETSTLQKTPAFEEAPVFEKMPVIDDAPDARKGSVFDNAPAEQDPTVEFPLSFEAPLSAEETTIQDLGLTEDSAHAVDSIGEGERHALDQQPPVVFESVESVEAVPSLPVVEEVPVLSESVPVQDNSHVDIEHTTVVEVSPVVEEGLLLSEPISIPDDLNVDIEHTTAIELSPVVAHIDVNHSSDIIEADGSREITDSGFETDAQSVVADSIEDAAHTEISSDMKEIALEEGGTTQVASDVLETLAEPVLTEVSSDVGLQIVKEEVQQSDDFIASESTGDAIAPLVPEEAQEISPDFTPSFLPLEIAIDASSSTSEPPVNPISQDFESEVYHETSEASISLEKLTSAEASAVIVKLDAIDTTDKDVPDVLLDTEPQTRSISDRSIPDDHTLLSKTIVDSPSEVIESAVTPVMNGEDASQPNLSDYLDLASYSDYCYPPLPSDDEDLSEDFGAEVILEQNVQDVAQSETEVESATSGTEMSATFVPESSEPLPVDIPHATHDEISMREITPDDTVLGTENDNSIPPTDQISSEPALQIVAQDAFTETHESAIPDAEAEFGESVETEIEANVETQDGVSVVDGEPDQTLTPRALSPNRGPASVTSDLETDLDDLSSSNSPTENALSHADLVPTNSQNRLHTPWQRFFGFNKPGASTSNPLSSSTPATQGPVEISVSSLVNPPEDATSQGDVASVVSSHEQDEEGFESIPVERLRKGLPSPSSVLLGHKSWTTLSNPRHIRGLVIASGSSTPINKLSPDLGNEGFEQAISTVAGSVDGDAESLENLEGANDGVSFDFPTTRQTNMTTEAATEGLSVQEGPSEISLIEATPTLDSAPIFMTPKSSESAENSSTDIVEDEPMLQPVESQDNQGSSFPVAISENIHENDDDCIVDETSPVREHVDQPIPESVDDDENLTREIQPTVPDSQTVVTEEPDTQPITELDTDPVAFSPSMQSPFDEHYTTANDSSVIDNTLPPAPVTETGFADVIEPRFNSPIVKEDDGSVFPPPTKPVLSEPDFNADPIRVKTPSLDLGSWTGGIVKAKALSAHWRHKALLKNHAKAAAAAAAAAGPSDPTEPKNVEPAPEKPETAVGRDGYNNFDVFFRGRKAAQAHKAQARAASQSNGREDEHDNSADAATASTRTDFDIEPALMHEPQVRSKGVSQGESCEDQEPQEEQVGDQEEAPQKTGVEPDAGAEEGSAYEYAPARVAGHADANAYAHVHEPTPATSPPTTSAAATTVSTFADTQPAVVHHDSVDASHTHSSCPDSIGPLDHSHNCTTSNLLSVEDEATEHIPSPPDHPAHEGGDPSLNVPDVSLNIIEQYPVDEQIAPETPLSSDANVSLVDEYPQKPLALEIPEEHSILIGCDVPFPESPIEDEPASVEDLFVDAEEHTSALNRAVSDSALIHEEATPVIQTRDSPLTEEPPISAPYKSSFTNPEAPQEAESSFSPTSPVTFPAPEVAEESELDQSLEVTSPTRQQPFEPAVEDPSSQEIIEKSLDNTLSGADIQPSTPASPKHIVDGPLPEYATDAESAVDEESAVAQEYIQPEPIELEIQLSNEPEASLAKETVLGSDEETKNDTHEFTLGVFSKVSTSVPDTNIYPKTIPLPEDPADDFESDFQNNGEDSLKPVEVFIPETGISATEPSPVSRDLGQILATDDIPASSALETQEEPQIVPESENTTDLILVVKALTAAPATEVPSTEVLPVDEVLSPVTSPNPSQDAASETIGSPTLSRSQRRRRQREMKRKLREATQAAVSDATATASVVSILEPETQHQSEVQTEQIDRSLTQVVEVSAEIPALDAVETDPKDTKTVSNLTSSEAVSQVDINATSSFIGTECLLTDPAVAAEQPLPESDDSDAEAEEPVQTIDEEAPLEREFKPDTESDLALVDLHGLVETSEDTPKDATEAQAESISTTPPFVEIETIPEAVTVLETPTARETETIANTQLASDVTTIPVVQISSEAHVDPEVQAHIQIDNVSEVEISSETPSDLGGCTVIDAAPETEATPNHDESDVVAEAEVATEASREIVSALEVDSEAMTTGFVLSTTEVIPEVEVISDDSFVVEVQAEAEPTIEATAQRFEILETSAESTSEVALKVESGLDTEVAFAIEPSPVTSIATELEDIVKTKATLETQSFSQVTSIPQEVGSRGIDPKVVPLPEDQTLELAPIIEESCIKVEREAEISEDTQKDNSYSTEVAQEPEWVADVGLRPEDVPIPSDDESDAETEVIKDTSPIQTLPAQDFTVDLRQLNLQGQFSVSLPLSESSESESESDSDSDLELCDEGAALALALDHHSTHDADDFKELGPTENVTEAQDVAEEDLNTETPTFALGLGGEVGSSLERGVPAEDLHIDEQPTEDNFEVATEESPVSVNLEAELSDQPLDLILNYSDTQVSTDALPDASQSTYTNVEAEPEITHTSTDVEENLVIDRQLGLEGIGSLLPSETQAVEDSVIIDNILPSEDAATIKALLVANEHLTLGESDSTNETPCFEVPFVLEESLALTQAAAIEDPLASTEPPPIDDLVDDEDSMVIEKHPTSEEPTVSLEPLVLEEVSGEKPLVAQDDLSSSESPALEEFVTGEPVSTDVEEHFVNEEAAALEETAIQEEPALSESLCEITVPDTEPPTIAIAADSHADDQLSATDDPTFTEEIHATEDFTTIVEVTAATEPLAVKEPADLEELPDPNELKATERSIATNEVTAPEEAQVDQFPDAQTISEPTLVPSQEFAQGLFGTMPWARALDTSNQVDPVPRLSAPLEPEFTESSKSADIVDDLAIVVQPLETPKSEDQRTVQSPELSEPATRSAAEASKEQNVIQGVRDDWMPRKNSKRKNRRNKSRALSSSLTAESTPAPEVAVVVETSNSIDQAPITEVHASTEMDVVTEPENSTVVVKPVDPSETTDLVPPAGAATEVTNDNETTNDGTLLLEASPLPLDQPESSTTIARPTISQSELPKTPRLGPESTIFSELNEPSFDDHFLDDSISFSAPTSIVADSFAQPLGREAAVPRISVAALTAAATAAAAAITANSATDPSVEKAPKEPLPPVLLTVKEPTPSTSRSHTPDPLDEGSEGHKKISASEYVNDSWMPKPNAYRQRRNRSRSRSRSRSRVSTDAPGTDVLKEVFVTSPTDSRGRLGLPTARQLKVEGAQSDEPVETLPLVVPETPKMETDIVMQLPTSETVTTPPAPTFDAILEQTKDSVRNSTALSSNEKSSTMRTSGPSTWFSSLWSFGRDLESSIPDNDATTHEVDELKSGEAVKRGTDASPSNQDETVEISTEKSKSPEFQPSTDNTKAVILNEASDDEASTAARKKRRSRRLPKLDTESVEEPAKLTVEALEKHVRQNSAPSSPNKGHKTVTAPNDAISELAPMSEIGETSVPEMSTIGQSITEPSFAYTPMSPVLELNEHDEDLDFSSFYTKRNNKRRSRARRSLRIDSESVVEVPEPSTTCTTPPPPANEESATSSGTNARMLRSRDKFKSAESVLSDYPSSPPRLNDGAFSVLPDYDDDGVSESSGYPQKDPAANLSFLTEISESDSGAAYTAGESHWWNNKNLKASQSDKPLVSRMPLKVPDLCPRTPSPSLTRPASRQQAYLHSLRNPEGEKPRQTHDASSSTAPENYLRLRRTGSTISNRSLEIEQAGKTVTWRQSSLLRAAEIATLSSSLSGGVASLASKFESQPTNEKEKTGTGSLARSASNRSLSSDKLKINGDDEEDMMGEIKKMSSEEELKKKEEMQLSCAKDLIARLKAQGRAQDVIKRVESPLPLDHDNTRSWEAAMSPSVAAAERVSQRENDKLRTIPSHLDLRDGSICDENPDISSSTAPDWEDTSSTKSPTRSVSHTLPPLKEDPKEPSTGAVPGALTPRRSSRYSLNRPASPFDRSMTGSPALRGARSSLGEESPLREQSVAARRGSVTPDPITRLASPRPRNSMYRDPEKKLQHSPFQERTFRDSPLRRTPTLREPSPNQNNTEPQKSSEIPLSDPTKRLLSFNQRVASPEPETAALDSPSKKPTSSSAPTSARSVYDTFTPRPLGRSATTALPGVGITTSSSAGQLPTARRSLSNTSLARQSTPPLAPRPDSPGSFMTTRSLRLRRTDRRLAAGLRSSQSHNDLTLTSENAEKVEDFRSQLQSGKLAGLEAEPIANEGRVRAKEATQEEPDPECYEGLGDAQIGSPISSVRPHSMRRRQSMQVIELTNRVDQLLEENQVLMEERQNFEVGIARQAAAVLTERNAEIDNLKHHLIQVRKELSRIREVNSGLNHANNELSAKNNEATREIERSRAIHEDVDKAILERDHEIAKLRTQLEESRARIRELQAQILAGAGAPETYLHIFNEDHFDTRCNALFQHIQQWVLRFSKFSDMHVCRPTVHIHDEKILDRLDNSVLDGTNVDHYLRDRVKRRDVFMSVTMNMVWEFVFTRFLFGMDREQRGKLKQLEKHLSEIGPPAAVRQWRAITLTLLSRRENFRKQRHQDAEAVVQAILLTLSALLPPPQNLQAQIQTQLRRVMHEAVDLSMEMRRQKAEYKMLPPPQPEYDTEGELIEPVPFRASTMHIVNSAKVSETAAQAEARGATVRMVLFPLVVKKANDAGEGDDEIVVFPAQVILSQPRKGSTSTAQSSDNGGVSMHSQMPPDDSLASA
ncbi:uncharacterized protein BROUX77_000719 [Berkeleyomyces rouxiae]|uniref:uncharacterized protein n=1 Tax=Berkeleyomyces rouxiae TaxID=2035830 RepID=UPI003B7A6772